MNIKPIRNDKDLQAVFRHLESIFQAAAGSEAFCTDNNRQSNVQLDTQHQNQGVYGGFTESVMHIKRAGFFIQCMHQQSADSDFLRQTSSAQNRIPKQIGTQPPTLTTTIYR
ncbi:MAG: hypothetical protein ACYCSZ_02185 [Burkholderiales bacterium]